MEKKDNGYVENTQTEAFASASVGAEGEESCLKNASTGIGKFKDVDALVKAYDCLQAEFTRRSQRLKQLEREAENFKRESASAIVVEKLRENAEKVKAEEEKFDGFIAELEGTNVRVHDEVAQQKMKPANQATGEGDTQAAETLDKNLFGPSADVNSVREVESKEVKGEEASPVTGETFVAESRGVQNSSEELYRMASEDEQVRLKIIGEYLQTLGKAGAPLAKGGNGLLSTPPIKARTVREAGEMALRWFKREGVEF